ECPTPTAPTAPTAAPGNASAAPTRAIAAGARSFSMPPALFKCEHPRDPGAAGAGEYRLGVAPGDLPEIERRGQRLLVDALLTRHFSKRAPRRGCLLHDLGRLVIADVRVQGRGRRERRLGM